MEIWSDLPIENKLFYIGNCRSNCDWKRSNGCSFDYERTKWKPATKQEIELYENMAEEEKEESESSIAKLSEQIAVLEEQLRLHQSIALPKRLTVRVAIIGFCIVGVISISVYVM